MSSVLLGSFRRVYVVCSTGYNCVAHYIPGVKNEQSTTKSNSPSGPYTIIERMGPTSSDDICLFHLDILYSMVDANLPPIYSYNH